MKLIVINGPNLNLLGLREPDVYGKNPYEDLLSLISAFGRKKKCEIKVIQHNGEGDIIDAIQGAAGAYDGIVINPGAYTHYSYAIHDALSSVSVPAVEVHISNIHRREEFRRHSVIAPACVGQLCGLGFFGYIAAMEYLLDLVGRGE
jgi:3-dehydroquinate dehydratase-2